MGPKGEHRRLIAARKRQCLATLITRTTTRALQVHRDGASCRRDVRGRDERATASASTQGRGSGASATTGRRHSRTQLSGLCPRAGRSRSCNRRASASGWRRRGSRATDARLIPASARPWRSVKVSVAEAVVGLARSESIVLFPAESVCSATTASMSSDGVVGECRGGSGRGSAHQSGTWSTRGRDGWPRRTHRRTL